MGAWYKDWYITTKVGEAELRTAIADPDAGAQNLTDVQTRLAEMKSVPDDRCAVTLDQQRFLERVLGSL